MEPLRTDRSEVAALRAELARRDPVSRRLATNAMRNKPVAVIGASAGVFGAV
jgi:hypothetical protein